MHVFPWYGAGMRNNTVCTCFCICVVHGGGAWLCRGVEHMLVHLLCDRNGVFLWGGVSVHVACRGYT